MDIRSQQLFLHLAQTLHFGRTSEHFHMSPSALTRAIKRLEGEVGHCLLIRDKRSVALSPAGKVFLAYAQESVVRWQKMSQSLSGAGEALSGELSLYCSVTASYGFLSPILARFRQQYPNIDIKLHTGDQALSLERAAKGLDDIVIAAEPDQLSDNLNFHALVRSRLCLVVPLMACSVSDLLAQRDVPWGDVPFIVPEAGVTRARLEQWWQDMSVKPRIYAQVSGHEAIVSMVALGFGVALVPELVIASSPVAASIQVLPVECLREDIVVGLCSSQARMDDPLIGAFWRVAFGRHSLPGAS